MVRRKIRQIINIAPAVVSVTAIMAKVYQKQLTDVQQGREIFPLTAPGLPPLPPNSAFLSHVQALGDEESKVISESVTTQDGKKATERKLIYSDQLFALILCLLKLVHTKRKQRHLFAAICGGLVLCLGRKRLMS